MNARLSNIIGLLCLDVMNAYAMVALNAAKQWVYKPATRGGQPVVAVWKEGLKAPEGLTFVC